MTKRELSKYDFDTLDKVLMFAAYNSKAFDLTTRNKAEELSELFAKAHTGWLEIEEE